MIKKAIAWIVFLIALGLLLYFYFFVPAPASGRSESEYHVHADFAVFVEGVKFDFAKREFMEPVSCGKPGEGGEESEIHLHDLNGNVLHVHDRNATLGEFFAGLNMSFTGECLFISGKGEFCTNQYKKLKLFVNGVEDLRLGSYAPKDLDRILVSYGDESPALVRGQFESVTNQSCIYSGTCPAPEGFAITPESCAD